MRPQVARWRPPLTAAVAATALLTLLAAFVTVHLPVGEHSRHPGALAATMVALGVLGAVATLRFPVRGTVLVAVALGAYLARDYPNGPVYATGLAAMFVLGRRTGRTPIVAGLVAIEAAMLIGWAVSGHGGPIVAFYPGWAAAAAAIGAAVRNRRSYLAEQAARIADLERTRAEEQLRSLAEDRLRIARDLHDGVAHAMATINIQSAAAAHVVDRQPAAAKDALAAIARASGTVLDELNAMLNVLRDPGEPAALSPTPALADVDRLIESVRAAGRSCELTTKGDLDQVSAPLSTAAYRIVQESLTNVLKHSDAGEVTVVIDADLGGVQVTVIDDGTAIRPPADGNGIRGMRERAEATGGTLTAAPGVSGFVVHADWPAAG